MACYPKRSALAAHPATSVAAAGLEIGILRWRGQARIIVEVEARTCPLRQLPDDASIPTAQPACPPPASVAVTAVTDLLFEYPIIFWTNQRSVFAPRADIRQCPATNTKT